MRILEAVGFLEEHGSSSALLAYLAGRKISYSPRGEAKSENKPVDEQRSKAAIDLERERH